MSAPDNLRLDRLLSLLSIATRSQAQMMARKGRILVDGQAARDASARVSLDSVLTLDGEEIDTRLTHHLMMNKPAGVLTAASDRRQKTVMDLLPAKYLSLSCMPVGRLDRDTQGLLLFTTDGTLNHRLLSPRQEVSKVYEATVTGLLTQAAVRRFEEGMDFKEFSSLPAKLEILTAQPMESTARVSVHEGKYHQVKRMFSACGHEVISLNRVSFGPLILDEGLAPAQYRALTPEELIALQEAAGIG